MLARQGCCIGTSKASYDGWYLVGLVPTLNAEQGAQLSGRARFMENAVLVGASARYSLKMH